MGPALTQKVQVLSQIVAYEGASHGRGAAWVGSTGQMWRTEESSYAGGDPVEEARGGYYGAGGVRDTGLPLRLA